MTGRARTTCVQNMMKRSFAEVYADATTVWPLLIKGVLDELKR